MVRAIGRDRGIARRAAEFDLHRHCLSHIIGAVGHLRGARLHAVQVPVQGPDHGGHYLICTPFAIAILSSAFQGLDQSFEEAAIDLGETRWGAFKNIILPLVAPGIVASFLICFTISLDEFIIAFFLTGAEPTLPVYIWGQLRFPTKIPAVMALGTLMLVASLIILSVAEFYRRRGVARVGGKDSGGFL